MRLAGPFWVRLIFHGFVVVVGTLDSRRGGEHGDCGFERSAEPRLPKME